MLMEKLQPGAHGKQEVICVGVTIGTWYSGSDRWSSFCGTPLEACMTRVFKLVVTRCSWKARSTLVGVTGGTVVLGGGARPGA